MKYFLLFLIISFSLLTLSMSKGFSQSCLDKTAEEQLTSILNSNSDYEVDWKKTVSVSSSIQTIFLKTESDEQYIIVLVWNSSVKSCGLEIQNSSGVQLEYEIKYTPGEQYYSVLDLDDPSETDYKILCNSSGGSCAQLIVLKKEKEEEDDRFQKRKY